MVKINKKIFMEKVGFMLAQEFALECPKKSTNMAKRFASTMRVKNNVIHYTLPKYADYVINGSAPHEIKAKNAKSLSVPVKDWTGKTPNNYGSGKFPMYSKDRKFVLLGKKVMHPGNKPNDFMDRVMQRKLKQIIRKAIELSIIK